MPPSSAPYLTGHGARTAVTMMMTVMTMMMVMVIAMAMDGEVDIRCTV